MNDDPRWAHGERVRRERSSDRGPGWERSIIEKLATESLKEQRRSRRWGIFFKLLGFGYLAAVVLLAFGKGLFQWPGAERGSSFSLIRRGAAVTGWKCAFPRRAVASIVTDQF